MGKQHELSLIPELHKTFKGALMHLLIAILTLTVSFAINAKSIKLAEFTADRSLSVYRTQFNVNKSMNRAWVEITMANDSFGDTYYVDKNVKVPGLSYDPMINGVVYQNGDEKILCGTFYNAPWTIDLGMSFAATGRCEIVDAIKSTSIDDGFYVRKVDQIVVELIIE